MDPTFPALLYIKSDDKEDHKGNEFHYTYVQVQNPAEWNDKIQAGYYPHPDHLKDEPDHEQFLIDVPAEEPKGKK